MSKTILVLEHEVGSRLMLEKHLTTQGFQVQLADNSHEGLSLAFDSPPNLIFLDLMLPDWASYQFLRHYRRRRNTPIITMTAKEEEAEAVRAFSLGAEIGVRGSGFGVRGSGFGVRGSGFGVRDSGFGIRGSGFGIRGSGFGIRGSGFGVRDSGFGVRG